MNIEISIDGLSCDGKLVMVFADASDLVARDKLIAEFEVPEPLALEEREGLEDEIADLNSKIDKLEDTIDRLEERIKNGLRKD